MSNSQEQSLDENAVFLPVIETSPEFLFSERERQAVERLLSFGPEAFYSSIGTERSACFLSPEEVSQITSWAQDYHCSELQVQKEENGENRNSMMGDFSSTYFPCYSDTPPPDLELGWPEKSPRMSMGNIAVHTSPPAEGEPPVREIIRRHLQQANQVIGIVTDRLTDSAIISDLHIAASRGVPVYIILNERTIQENFTLNRLRHPNMRVRVLGGKTFCSREGKMVVGQLKDKFLLVDLQTVIHGSYSLTWTDAHLHRQLITVLSGPVVESFDKEFRILFAASLPVPDMWRVASINEDTAHQIKDISDLRFQKHLPLEQITNPPSPPVDTLLDWEAMGVMHRQSYPDSPLDHHEEIIRAEMPQQNNMLFDKKTPVVDGLTQNGGQFVDRRRVFEKTSPVTNNVPDKSRTFNNTQPSPTDLATADIMKRMERKIGRAISRQLSKEKDTNANERATTRLDDKYREPTLNTAMLSSKRKEHSKRESMMVEEKKTDETSTKVENTPFSRKPLILVVPQSERHGPLSDILKRLRPQPSTSGLKGPQGTKSEVSRSMMDLSIHNTEADQDGRAVPVPRLKAGYFDPGYMTPALALMKKRNDDMKSVLYRTPISFQPKQRPRSATYSLSTEWRRSLAEREGEQE